MLDKFRSNLVAGASSMSGGPSQSTADVERGQHQQSEERMDEKESESEQQHRESSQHPGQDSAVIKKAGSEQLPKLRI